MNTTFRLNAGKAGFVLCSALLMLQTGCIGYVEPSHHERVYASPPPAVVVVQDDYVYYPGYQVYYSSSRHHYVYQEGRAWVTRPAPPHVSVDVLVASPSVRLGFHDAPASHHATVVKQYPKHWAPPKAGPNHGEGNGNGNGNGKDKDGDKDHGDRK